MFTTPYDSAGEHYLQGIVRRQKRGECAGIYSICSAHPLVIAAAMEQAIRDGTPVLIEATCNQVNQFGGYTGMRPLDFSRLVRSIAGETGFPAERIILGGDHLGPNPWQDEPAAAAMEKAVAMVREYAAAGYSKIHLDASMFLGDDAGDRTRRLDIEVIAERTARLCEAAEAGYREWKAEHPAAPAPVYVVGSEVPVPGGVQSEDEALEVTEPESLKETVAATEEAFRRAGLEEAYQRVVAVVVQPGVEFGDEYVHEYRPERARELVAAIDEFPGLVFEGHSTDYQTRESLRALVRDKVAILKVGPGLTFAMREALFALAHIEEELARTVARFEPSDLRGVLDRAMVRQPSHWRKYYRGTEGEMRFKRAYSLSDRSRYYWSAPDVARAVDTLFANLQTGIPPALLSQFLPDQFAKVRRGELEDEPGALVRGRIRDVLADYAYAVTP